MNKFDRILWRVNGVVLLGFLIFSLVYTVWVAVSLRHFSIGEPPHPPAVSGPVVTAPGADENKPLHLTFSFTVKGTPFLRIALEIEGSSGKFSLRSCYNYLYINSSDLSSWWLFERNDRLITGVHDLRAEADNKDAAIIASVWEVVTSDTDGDGRLTQNDREAIYFCRADGRKPIEIIPPTDGLKSIEQVASDRALLVYKRDPDVVAALISLSDGSKIKESILATKPAER